METKQLSNLLCELSEKADKLNLPLDEHIMLEHSIVTILNHICTYYAEGDK